MSIKIKLSLIMTVFAVTLLTINIVLSFFTTRDNLRKDSEANMILIAKQIAVAVEQSRSVYEHIKNGTGPGIDRKFIEDTLSMTSPELITQESMQANSDLLEITGINPIIFESGQTLMFGTYRYKNDTLVAERAHKALQQNTPCYLRPRLKVRGLWIVLFPYSHYTKSPT